MNRLGIAPGNPKLLLPRCRLLRVLPAAVLRVAKKRKTFCSMANSNLTAREGTGRVSCSRGERQDQSGPAVAQLLEKLKFSVTVREIVPDVAIKLQNLLIHLSREGQLTATT